MDRGLSDDTDRILADNVESCKYAISLVLSERFEQSFSCIVGRVSRRFFVLELDLAADASDLVE